MSAVPIVFSRENPRILGYIEEREVARAAGHYEEVRGRRGKLKRVILRHRQQPLIHLQRTGMSFEQQLDAGSVWALNGVEGSQSPHAATRHHRGGKLHMRARAERRGAVRVLEVRE